MADEKQPQTRASNAPASGATHEVHVQAPWGSIELSDNWKFKAGEPKEVSAEEAKLIREAADAAGVTGGLVVVEKQKENG